MIWQALGHVHGAEIVHAPEPIHGRLRYTQLQLQGFLVCFQTIHRY